MPYGFLLSTFWGAFQENEGLRTAERGSQHGENERRASAQKEKSLQQKTEDEKKTAERPAWEAEKTAESRNEVRMLDYPSYTILTLRQIVTALGSLY